MYPFFAAMLGWLGVALTGSDTSSNVLFGSLQKITATSLGLNPLLMAAANSSGGVMGKMIDAQSIWSRARRRGTSGTSGGFCDSCSFTVWCSPGSSACSCMLQQYVYPFTLMVVR